MAFPTGWGRKQEIIFDYTKVVGASDHTNIFVPIKKNYLDAEILNASGNSALSGGLDIRVTTDEDGLNEIPVHMLVCNPDATEGNRKFAAFVLLPNLSVSVNTSIWIWYRNASATLPAVTDTYGRNAVWAQMEAVILGNEASGTFYDATGNGYDATLTAGTRTVTATDHPIDGLTWIDFDGSSYYTLASSAGMLDGSANMFLSAWHVNDNNFTFRGLIGNRNNTPSDSNWFQTFSRPQAGAKAGGSEDYIEGTSIYSTGVLTFSAFQHTASELNIYTDGVLNGQDTSISVTSGITGVADYRLGTYYSGSSKVDARAGLFMAGFGPYDADWLETIYNSVVDADFASAGTPGDVVANNPATGSVVIAGTTTQGETLTATDTIADADGLGAFTYTWYRDDVLISGANASTYVLTAFDVNTTIKARIDFTDGGGAAEYKVSAGVGPVAAASATTYQECFFISSINPTFVPSTQNNVFIDLLTADVPASFYDGGSQSAANGGGNIRVYTSPDFVDANRLPLKINTFNINTGVVDMSTVVPVVSGAVPTDLYWVKINPDAVQPAANDTYGSDNVDLYDPATLTPSGDLATLYTNMATEADFLTSGSLTCSTVGFNPDTDSSVRQGLRHASFNALHGGAMGSYNQDVMLGCKADEPSITATHFNGILMQWLELKGYAHATLDGRLNAFAIDQGYPNWSATGTFSV